MTTKTTAIFENGPAENGKSSPVAASLAPSIPSSPTASATASLLPASRLAPLVESFVLASDIARHSERTLATKRERLGRIVWFAKREGWDTVSIVEMRAFFAYLNHGHKQPGGRWGNPRMTKPITSGRVKSYYSTLRAFFRWLIAEEEIAASPMVRIPVPIDRPDQVQPFTGDQCRALLEAAKRTTNPLRDEALLCLMLDNGIRASELCSLTRGDISLEQCEVTVRCGKGGKTRQLPFSRVTRKALYRYLADRSGVVASTGDLMEPLFIADRGRDAAHAMTANGLFQLIRRVGRMAKIAGVRCSPHTFRHTFAITFLRAGGNIFTLRIILGHETLAMTNRYVALAEADITVQHRQFSPVEHLYGKKG
jgi:site-specific recombinase XerD